MVLDTGYTVRVLMCDWRTINSIQIMTLCFNNKIYYHFVLDLYSHFNLSTSMVSLIYVIIKLKILLCNTDESGDCVATVF